MDEPQAPLTEREAFEAWCAQEYGGRWRIVVRGMDAMVSAWDAWQARAALSAAPVQGPPAFTPNGSWIRQPLPDPVKHGELHGYAESFWTGDQMLAYGESCARAALASAPHPTTPSNTLGDALTGPGDPVASLPAPPIATGDEQWLRDRIDVLEASLRNIEAACVYSPYRELGQWDQALAGAIHVAAKNLPAKDTP